jgi:hypothetical protein
MLLSDFRGTLIRSRASPSSRCIPAPDGTGEVRITARPRCALFPLGIESTMTTIDHNELLTPSELAERLKVPVSWVFEQTRQRAKVRNDKPLPCIRLGKYLRFSWVAVCEWMAQSRA